MFHALAEPYRDLFERQRSFIFLVSHMRSYSSLLGHLLASTGEIDGYSELHQSYASELDLVRMAIDVQNTYDEPLQGHRLFDKLLHRGSTLEGPILTRPDVRIILAARTPGPTLASMIALGSRDVSVKWASNPARALLHYQRRLGDMQDLASHMGAGAVMVSDELVRDTKRTRAELGAFLDVDAIPDTYELQALTGQKRFGDSSASISSGSIQSPSDHDLSSVPADILAEGHAAFRDFVSHPAINRLLPIGELDRY